MAEHAIVKPQKLVNAAVGVLEGELVVPKTFLRKGVDDFKGAEDDTINMKVPGTLPARDYAWRNDRSTEIEFDEYAERKIAVSFGGNKYSAVKITDEQKDFDLESENFLPSIQARAVAAALEHGALGHLADQSFEVTIGNVEQNFKGAFIEARRVLNRFLVPKEQRVILVGSDFAAALLEDEKMGLTQNVGESEGVNMLQNATVGRRYGFTFVEAEDMEPTKAIAYVPSAFTFLTAAPSIPGGQTGATINYDGLALRWMRQYNGRKFQNESVVNCYYGFNTTKDPLRYWDSAANGGNGMEKITASEYLVRAIELDLDGASNYPAAASEIAKATGVSDASVWTPTGRKAETDPANV